MTTHTPCLEETLDDLDILLTNSEVAGFRPLIERAKEQARKLNEQNEALERERDEAESEREWTEQHMVDPDTLGEERSRVLAWASDVLLDVRRGLFTLDEALERLQDERED